MGIEVLLRQLGRQALLDEAKAAGLSPQGSRLKCPWGCAHAKGPNRERDAVVFSGGHPRIHCYSCETTGDLVDLLVATRGWTKGEALAHLEGQQAPPARPTLVSVPVPPADDPDKLRPQVVQQLWDTLARSDEVGEAYLASRHLEDAVALGLARFVGAGADEKAFGWHRARGHIVAVLTSDVTGQPRGVQLRLARDARAKEPKVMSLKGSATGSSFFGRPGSIEYAHTVVVAEGLADTLAASVWSVEHAVVVGATGKGNLPRLAEELASAGIDLEGKLFVLLPQNDRPANKSRAAFRRLAQLLSAAKARVVWVATPSEHKDVADWWAAAHPEWPPREVRSAHQREPGEDDPSAGDAKVAPPGCSVPVPPKVTTEVYRQDFTTLCALLDDTGAREAILGSSDLAWCEMRQLPLIGGVPVAEVDLTAVRLAIEAHGVSTATGKALRFGEEDIAKALLLLSRRRTIHPVRDWLCELHWDGTSRTAGLTRALGHEPDSLAATLLRRWLVSAVARAMVPGCKVDTVLVLVGGQGVLKSTVFSSLAGDEWFTDSPVHADDRDSLLVMREVWVVEWQELDALRRARSQDVVKAFLSSRVDVFRRPYAKGITKAPRHCVIVGTTNNVEFLHDPTGSRRFWPIDIRGRTLDLDWVQANREQLWAQAVADYREGVQWWLTEQEDEALACSNMDHEESDAWTELVADWSEANPMLSETTIGRVLAEAIGREPSTWSRGDEMRIARVLGQLGWTGPHRRRVKGSGGQRISAWRRAGATKFEA